MKSIENAFFYIFIFSAIILIATAILSNPVIADVLMAVCTFTAVIGLVGLCGSLGSEGYDDQISIIVRDQLIDPWLS